MSLVKWNIFFVYYSIKHIAVLPHNATGKQLYKDLISLWKDICTEHKEVIIVSRNRLHCAVLNLKVLIANEKKQLYRDTGYWTKTKQNKKLKNSWIKSAYTL